MYLINQPQERLIDKLKHALQYGEFERFTFCVAYAKMSGVNLIKDSIGQFRERGGEIVAVVGIDQMNTSIEALRDLLALCNRVYIFHAENFSQTYHPKMYFLNKESNYSEVIIGSGNLTNGGLLNNFELNFGAVLKYDNTEDKKIIDGIKETIDSYITTEGLCFPLDELLLERLITNGYVFSEEKLATKAIAENEGSKKKEKIFGSSKTIIRPPRAAIVRSKTEEVSVESLVEEEISEIEEIETELNTGFWKKLSPNDVSATSSPGQIIIPKSFKESFPPFVNHKTTSAGAQQEEAFLNIKFINSTGGEILVNNARAIYYSPAPEHPRQNNELRFTFLNSEVFDLLQANDILVFEKTKDININFIVRQIKPDMPEYSLFQGRYQELN